jgi:hypothetical protein
MKEISFIAVLFFLISSCRAQKLIEESIPPDVIEFLSEAGEFDGAESSSDLVYIVDIVKKRMFSKGETGLYRLGVTASHAKTYLMVFDGSTYKFYDETSDLSAIFIDVKKLVAYDCDQKMDAASEVIKFYQNKTSPPWKE